MNTFKQITTSFEISNWFWITLCHIFQLFSCWGSCSKFIYIFFYNFAFLCLAECLLSTLRCMQFAFLNTFHLFIVYYIHRKKKTVRRPMTVAFFPRTARLWNSLSADCFPLTNNLNRFKGNVSRHLVSLTMT